MQTVNRSALPADVWTVLRGLREDASECQSPARLARIQAEIEEIEADLEARGFIVE